MGDSPTVEANFKYIGRSRQRLEGPDKLRGRAQYVADLRIAGAYCARMILSPHARARIRSISTRAATNLPGVLAVLTDADLGEAQGRGLLASDQVYYAGQPVAVVVATDDGIAEDAAELVEVEYEPLPAIVDPLAAMQTDTPLVLPENLMRPESSGNVNQMVHYQRGNSDRAWALADVVITGTYTLAGVHQGYMEPHAVVAEPRSDGGINLWASTQGVFTLQRRVADTLGLPDHLVRVIPMTIGGGFGGKMVLHHPLIAQIARVLNHPVRLIYDRIQDFLSSKPAPATIINMRLGARRDGTLVALSAEMIMDSGAAPGAPVPTACLVLGSTYRLEHLDVKGYEVLTNKAPVGPYRAPGATQAFFALECHLDQLARKLQMDPIELRLRNAAREGDLMAHGKPWPAIGLMECLEKARTHPLWTRRRSEDGEGYGVAAGGWLGGVEPAVAACRLHGDGTFSLHIGAVDVTGTSTALGMIAAEVLGLHPDRIRVVSGDSDQAPFSGQSAGSKIIYTVGEAVRLAAEEARQQVLAIAADQLEVSPEDLEISDTRVQVRGAPSRSLELKEIARLCMSYGSRYAPVHGFGRTAIYKRSPGFGVHVVKVRVDEETGVVRPMEYLAIQDVGKAINPAEVIGQIHGGVAQGIGRALLEQMTYDELGQLKSASFMDYLLPTTIDVPTIQVELIEKPSPYGPFGAKGVAEPPAVPGVAAIANAVADATGIRITDAPITPTRFLQAKRAVERAE